jgi:hypothetical protein
MSVTASRAHAYAAMTRCAWSLSGALLYNGTPEATATVRSASWAIA